MLSICVRRFLNSFEFFVQYHAGIFSETLWLAQKIASSWRLELLGIITSQLVSSALTFIHTLLATMPAQRGVGDSTVQKGGG